MLVESVASCSGLQALDCRLHLCSAWASHTAHTACLCEGEKGGRNKGIDVLRRASWLLLHRCAFWVEMECDLGCCPEGLLAF